MVVKNLKPLLILFFKTVLFFSIRTGLLIGTIFLYMYQSPVSVLFLCIYTNLWYRYRFAISWYSI